jgi:hypothetical protein
MGPHEFNVLLGCFGVAAALLLIGGSVMLRAQQNRHRFELAKKSLETGHALPPAEPLWKGLHRQAQSILAVGLGLLIVGFVAWVSGTRVERPPQIMVDAPLATTQPAAVRNPFGPPPPPPRPSPEVELWQRAQVRIAIGQSAMGCGVILTLLGLSRRSAARTERQSLATTSPPSN